MSVIELLRIVPLTFSFTYLLRWQTVVYDRNHLFGLGSDTQTETENWPKLSADTETNRNQKILNWKALYQGVCKNSLYRHSGR